MKSFIKAFMILSFLNIGILTLPMKQDDTKTPEDTEQNTVETEPQNFETQGLPNEIWFLILDHLYYQPNISADANDIYEGIAIIQKNIPRYYQTISLVCGDFKSLNMPWTQFKEKIRKFYIIELNHRFLESRQDKKGLRPKNDDWDTDIEIDKKIAKFILNKNTSDNDILSNLISKYSCNKDFGLKLKIKKIISLLLFYGANVNKQNKHSDTPLTLAVSFHDKTKVNNKNMIVMMLARGAYVNISDVVELSPFAPFDHNITSNNKDIIVMLLIHGADVNISSRNGHTPLYSALIHHQNNINDNNEDIIIMLLTRGAYVNISNNCGLTPLYSVISYHHDIDNNNKNRIALLLAYGATPDLAIKNGETPRSLAREKKLDDFEQLVEIYSPKQTLKFLCIKFILTRPQIFEGKLYILPDDLKKLFKF